MLKGLSVGLSLLSVALGDGMTSLCGSDEHTLASSIESVETDVTCFSLLSEPSAAQYGAETSISCSAEDGGDDESVFVGCMGFTADEEWGLGVLYALGSCGGFECRCRAASRGEPVVAQIRCCKGLNEAQSSQTDEHCGKDLGKPTNIAYCDDDATLISCGFKSWPLLENNNNDNENETGYSVSWDFVGVYPTDDEFDYATGERCQAELEDTDVAVTGDRVLAFSVCVRDSETTDAGELSETASDAYNAETGTTDSYYTRSVNYEKGHWECESVWRAGSEGATCDEGYFMTGCGGYDRDGHFAGSAIVATENGEVCYAQSTEEGVIGAQYATATCCKQLIEKQVATCGIMADEYEVGQPQYSEEKPGTHPQFVDEWPSFLRPTGMCPPAMSAADSAYLTSKVTAYFLELDDTLSNSEYDHEDPEDPTYQWAVEWIDTIFTDDIVWESFTDPWVTGEIGYQIIGKDWVTRVILTTNAGNAFSVRVMSTPMFSNYVCDNGQQTVELTTNLLRSVRVEGDEEAEQTVMKTMWRFVRDLNDPNSIWLANYRTIETVPFFEKAPEADDGGDGGETE